jgi:hypothetical protein
MAYPMKMNMEKIGEWLFLIGVIIAILAGVVSPSSETVAAVLVILGLVVGFLNITEKEATNFLIAVIALILTGSVSFVVLGEVGKVLSNIMGYISIFVAPAALIVSLKAIYQLASKK